MFRIGSGYDVHRLVAGRNLIIGGVTIEFDRGLDGHSDADVLLHAMTDALLGAAGLEDIGHHFPDTDPENKDISSILILEKVADLIEAKGYDIGNIDSTVIAEEPKIGRFRDRMKNNICSALSIGIDQVNVKATTNEKLGAIGSGEGIASFATVLLIKKS